MFQDWAYGAEAFIVTGQIVNVLQRVVGDVNLMAYTSANSHNLWMMVGSWQSSDQPLVGSLTPTMIGVSLFVGRALRS